MTKQKLKRALCFLLVFFRIFALTAYARPDWPSDVGIQAEAGIVMDLDSGAVLLGQNSHVAYPPASITKILTALIVLEHADLSDTVVFSETAMNSVERDSGNKLSLVAGDTMTVEDCLYALLLVSVNQAANALAEHVAGSIPAFVDMMNEKLAELGLTESHFDNPSGLNGDTQFVSAHDMAIIAQAAYENETLLKISSTLTYKIGPTENNPEGKTISHEHRLLYTTDPSSQYYYPDAVAGKTGYLIAAGNTLVTYAEKDGRRLVSVILKGQPRQYFVDAKELLIFGFDRFYNADIAENETSYVTGDAPVEIGGKSYAPSELMFEPGRVITLPNSAAFADAELTLMELPESYPRGAVALLQYIYNEREIGSAFLVVRSEYLRGQQGESEIDFDAPESSPEESPAVGTEEPAQGRNPWEVTFVTINLPLALGGIAIIAVIAFVAFLGIGVTSRRKKEAEERERRRERRRQRLLSQGLEEDEFKRMLEERRNRNRDRS